MALMQAYKSLIVAVHGLNPTSTEHHAEATWTANGRLWLRDFLPAQLPQARILLFGYNANVAFESSVAGVRGQAENLLNRLDLARSALHTTKLNPQYEPIGRATYGIAFFATPHQGGNFAGLGDIAATIARSFVRSPKNSFMEALQKDTLFGDELVQNFRHLLEDFRILSFRESLPFKKLGLIVDSKSATLGLAGARETVIDLDADHANACKFASTDDDAYVQVAGNLCRLVGSAVREAANLERLENLGAVAAPTLPSPATGPEGPHFLVPYTENPSFVGRHEILAKVKERLRPGPDGQADWSQSRVALCGLGGVGKTQIALQYAYWLRREHPECSVFWIHASSVGRFQKAFKQVAQDCRIPGAQNPEADLLVLVRDWLKGPSSGKWLMIIDNADDGDLFESCQREWPVVTPLSSQADSPRLGEFVPDCSHGAILVTTRNKQAGDLLMKGRELSEVQRMSESESADLVRRSLQLRDGDTEDLDRLAKSLECLPLALAQSAAYMRWNSMRPGRYLELLEKKPLGLLSHSFEDSGRDLEMPNAVVSTWILSFEQIAEKKPLAAKLLQLMACLDRQAIPMSLIRGQLDEDEVERALGILKAFSLITEDESGDAYSLHRLVQMVTRQWSISRDAMDTFAEEALDLVACAFLPSDAFEDWDQCSTLLPHARAILSITADKTSASPARAPLLCAAGLHLSTQGPYQEAKSMLQEAYAIRLRLKGPDHQDTLSSMIDLGLVYIFGHCYDEAFELVTEVVATQQSVLGPNHPRTLSSMHYLAMIYDC
ncbi:MAG: hypothetical protein M1817_002531 [Caeruleum heppii]|nr:MAG: hypothetical protein M1817_002531 [Caeruleum heppii]